MNKVPQTVSSRSIYKNQYVEVKVDELSFGENVWEQAYFMKPNKNAVGVLPVDETGLYLLNQYRYASQRWFWQIPLGMIDVGSDKTETARRELLEEAGITAEKFTPIGSFVAEPGMSDQETFMFVAQGLTFGKKNIEINEVGMELKHFMFEEIDEYVKSGKITCGFTLSALLLFKNNFR